MDNKSKIILEMLRKNARLSVSEIARTTGIHRNTVSNKIEILNREYIDIYTVDLKKTTAEKDKLVFVKIDSQNSKNMDSMEMFLEKENGITEWFRTSGYWTFVAFVNGSFSKIELNKFYDDVSTVGGLETETIDLF